MPRRTSPTDFQPYNVETPGEFEPPALTEVHPSLREIAVLRESTEMILSSMDVDSVLHQILLIVRNYFAATTCAVFLVDSPAQELYRRAAIGYDDAVPERRYKIGRDGVIGGVAHTKAPVYVPDVRSESRYITADPKIQSEIALPLVVREEVIGVLDIESDKPDHFSADMIALLSLFAGQAAVALENARLYSTERRRMRQIELINLIARSATAASDVEQLLSTLADLINDTFDGVDVCILLRENDGRLKLRAHAGLRHELPDNFAASERTGVIAQAFADRMNVVINDLPQRKDWPACLPGAGSELCVPLVSFGETLGALLISHPAQQFFGTDDRAIAQAAADVCATAIRNVQLAEELRRVSNTDSLTGVFNQRYFHVLVAQEAHRSRRYHKQFSLLMVELKDFHELNSTHGFDRGDQVLRELGEWLKGQLRSVDSVCRYGLDRFVMVLPETNTDRVATVIGKIQEKISRLRSSPSGVSLAVRYAVVSYPQDGVTDVELVRNLLARISPARTNAAGA
jgi:diguanylate cyclase (GGDEF)-like protein